MVRFALRHEMARRRRGRAGPALAAAVPGCAAAAAQADAVAAILAEELGPGFDAAASAAEFKALAALYQRLEHASTGLARGFAG
jgi:hypothetical protein